MLVVRYWLLVVRKTYNLLLITYQVVLLKEPFVSSFATCLQASLNIILGHADCRWLPPQT